MCIIAVTGHRPNKLDNDYNLTSPKALAIEAEIKRVFIEQNAEMVIVGMALGIDTLAALVAMEEGIPFTAAIPFRGQELRWAIRSQAIYLAILKQAARVVYVHDGPAPEQSYLVSKYMQDRNIWMVDNANKLLAVWDGSSGGTKNCVVYAGNKIPRMEILRIDPRDFVN